jgi:hypothetical protein
LKICVAAVAVYETLVPPNTPSNCRVVFCGSTEEVFFFFDFFFAMLARLYLNRSSVFGDPRFGACAETFGYSVYVVEVGNHLDTTGDPFVIKSVGTQGGHVV